MSFVDNIMSRVGYIKKEEQPECPNETVFKKWYGSNPYSLFSDNRGVLDTRALEASYTKVACVANSIDIITNNLQMIKPVFCDESNASVIEHPVKKDLRAVSRLFKKPNSTDTVSTFTSKVVKNHIIHGVVYFAFYMDGKVPNSIKVLNFNDVSEFPDISNNRIGSYLISNSGIYNGQYFFDGMFYKNKTNPNIYLAPLVNPSPQVQYQPASILNGCGVETLLYWYGCYHNKSLLERGARPSLALLFKAAISSKAREQLREELREFFSGVSNSGRPMIIDGAADKEIKELSQNNKDMEFASILKAAEDAIYKRLGTNWILSDKVASKDLSECLEVFYDMTVCPLFEMIYNHLFGICKYFNSALDNYSVCFLEKNIPALRPRFMKMMSDMPNLGIFVIKERRAMYGYPPLGDDRDNELSAPTVKVTQTGKEGENTTAFDGG